MTFNNPDRRNAVSLEMWEAVGEIMDDFSKDPDVRCCVMHGAGDKAFVSGADISQFKEMRNSAEAAAEYDRISQDARQKLSGFEKPLIAMIRGYCLGGGLGVAMNADFRIATEDSQFGIPAARRRGRLHQPPARGDRQAAAGRAGGGMTAAEKLRLCVERCA